MKKLIFAVFIIATSVALGHGQSGDDAFRKCDAAYGQGKYADAVKECTKAIEANPQLDDARLTRAAAYERLGNDDAAVADYTELIRQTGGTAMLFYFRAGIYRKKPGSTKALDDLSAAIAKEPSGRYAARAYYQRGLINDELGRADQAQSDYRRALSLDPKMAEAKSRLKYPFGDMTITEAADNIIPGIPPTQTVQTTTPTPAASPAPKPSATPVPPNRPATTPPPVSSKPAPAAPAQTERPKPPTPPVEPEDKPVEPSSWVPLLSAGNAKIKAKDYAGAAQSFTDCLAVTKAFFCYHGRATAYLMQKKYTLAMDDVTAALKQWPKSSELYHVRGLINAMQGETILAIGDLDKAIEFDDTNAELYLLRATLHCKIKEFRMLATDDEKRAKELGGKVIKPCR